MKWIRRLIIFLLGIILLLDSLTDTFHVFEFIIALIMIGLIPIDQIIDVISQPVANEIEINHLRKVMTDIPDPEPSEEEGNDKDHPDTTPDTEPNESS